MVATEFAFDLTAVQLTVEEEIFVSRLTDALSEVWGKYHSSVFDQTQRLLETEFGEQAEEKRIEHLNEMTDAWEAELLDEPDPKKFAVFVTVELRRPIIQAAEA